MGANSVLTRVRRKDKIVLMTQAAKWLILDTYTEFNLIIV